MWVRLCLCLSQTMWIREALVGGGVGPRPQAPAPMLFQSTFGAVVRSPCLVLVLVRLVRRLGPLPLASSTDLSVIHLVRR